VSLSFYGYSIGATLRVRKTTHCYVPEFIWQYIIENIKPVLKLVYGRNDFTLLLELTKSYLTFLHLLCAM